MKNLYDSRKKEKKCEKGTVNDGVAVIDLNIHSDFNFFFFLKFSKSKTPCRNPNFSSKTTLKPTEIALS